jgi:hypothetical protein
MKVTHETSVKIKLTREEAAALKVILLDMPKDCEEHVESFAYDLYMSL